MRRGLSSVDFKSELMLFYLYLLLEKLFNSSLRIFTIMKVEKTTN